MSAGKGNKHSSRKTRIKNFKGSKIKKAADAAKRFNHRRKKEKKDERQSP